MTTKYKVRLLGGTMYNIKEDVFYYDELPSATVIVDDQGALREFYLIAVKGGVREYRLQRSYSGTSLSLLSVEMAQRFAPVHKLMEDDNAAS